MAEFIVEFEGGTLPPPTYDDYNKDEEVLCGDDVHTRTIVFNNTGDFVLGLNFSSNYPPASTIRLESFTDNTIEMDATTGAITQNPAPGSSPSNLYRISTNTPLTYPYTIAVSDLSDIGLQNASVELVCNDTGGKFIYQRKRAISYYVTDSNGLTGDLRTSTLTTNNL